MCQFGWILRTLLQGKEFFSSEGLEHSPPFMTLLGYFSDPLHPDFQPCSSPVLYMGALGMKPVVILFLVFEDQKQCLVEKLGLLPAIHCLPLTLQINV